jgi:hypothetical protein
MMSRKPFVIPASFWKSLNEDEAIEAMSTSRFNAKLCARLWHFLNRQDEPPPSLTLTVSKKDVERVWPESQGSSRP